jgi:alkylation response protein AidB-like acyl-CoA dehydrogenase
MTLAPDLHALSDELLERIAARASDVEHRSRDFEDLGRAGYLLLAVPVEFGGLGGNLAQACDQQRRLARRSPATARATTMHIAWTGVAADLYRGGESSLNWLLEAAVAGEIFPGGQRELGDDDVFVRDSLTWTRCIFASVLLGVADRALELAVAEAKRRTAHPMMQHLVAEMAVEVEAGSSLAEHVAHDWTVGIDHGDRWMAKLAAVERWAADGARRVVELALEVTGKSPPPELERLSRDIRAVELPDSVHELAGQAVLARVAY